MSQGSVNDRFEGSINGGFGGSVSSIHGSTCGQNEDKSYVVPSMFHV